MVHPFSHYAHLKDLSFISLFTGGKLLLVEKFLSEDKTGPENPVVGSLFSAIMGLEGDYKTELEYRDMLEKMGFTSLPEIAQYSPYYLPLNVFTASKGSNLYILFAITAAGVVPCGGRKKSPRTSSIVQIIFLFRSFEISKDIQSVQNTHV